MDGVDPAEAMIAWGPWVTDMTAMIDGDGAWVHFYHPGSLSEQPAIDMQIFSIAKKRWVERVNEKIRNTK